MMMSIILHTRTGLVAGTMHCGLRWEHEYVVTDAGHHGRRKCNAEVWKYSTEKMPHLKFRHRDGKVSRGRWSSIFYSQNARKLTEFLGIKCFSFERRLRRAREGNPMHRRGKRAEGAQ